MPSTTLPIPYSSETVCSSEGRRLVEGQDAENACKGYNGDDSLFKCNEEFYEGFWKPAVAAIGFTLSPGKNYVSPAFLTVNSEGWKPLPNGRFEKVGYLNTGLIYAGPDGSMRPPLRSAHAQMPWAGKWKRSMVRLTRRGPQLRAK